MARKKRDEIQERDIGGVKYFDQLAPLLERLHDDGCSRDNAGNRTLHVDQLLAGVAVFVQSDLFVVAGGAAGVGVAQGAEAAGLCASGIGVVVRGGDGV